MASTKAPIKKSSKSIEPKLSASSSGKSSAKSSLKTRASLDQKSGVNSGQKSKADRGKAVEGKAIGGRTARSASKAPAQPVANGTPKLKIVYEPFDFSALIPNPIIGVDEVGRGCLAGPVFAAAVILPFDFAIEGITDSKLLSESRREVLAELIHNHAQVGIGFASVGEIDRLNILQASFLAMRRAIENLQIGTGHVLVDGNQRIPNLEGFRQTTLVKGDLRATPIGAASIVAKVARDTMMKRLAETHNVYGFEKHKGYASSVHIEAIQKHGPCVHHRSTFAGVREHWTELLDEERARDPF